VVLSTTRDIGCPAFAAAAAVISISRKTPVVEPGVKVATVVPFAGRLAYVIPDSVQVLLATFFTLCAPGEPFVTNIRSLADVIVWPASGPRSKRRYDSSTGEPSVRRSGVRPKLVFCELLLT
jgi:hypothetical protein